MEVLEGGRVSGIPKESTKKIVVVSGATVEKCKKKLDKLLLKIKDVE